MGDFSGKALQTYIQIHYFLSPTGYMCLRRKGRVNFGRSETNAASYSNPQTNPQGLDYPGRYSDSLDNLQFLFF